MKNTVRGFRQAVGAWLTGLLVLIGGLSSPENDCQAAIAFVQAIANSPLVAVSSVAATYPNAQVAGDINIVAISWQSSTGSVSSITDTMGNTYTLAIGPTLDSGIASQSIYYAKNIAAAAAGTNTITVALSGSLSNPDLRIAEYSGISASSPVDVTVGATGSSTAISSGSVTTTNANDLLIGADVVAHSTTGPGTSYTQRLLTTHADIFEDSIVTATGSYSATAPQDTSGWWVMQMAAFKAATSGGDTTPPTAPTGLGATVVSSTAINLSWTASTDNVGVTGYRVERCSGASCTTFAQIGSPTATSYSDTGLTASTSYSYRVRATDAAGNLSAYSSTVSATTQAGADTTPPTAPTGLGATVVSSSAINLTWTASTDNVGVTGYKVERCSGASCTTFAQIGTPTATSYSDTGLTASTSYSYRVRATDAAGNLSAYSSTVSATTQAGADTTPPTAPTGLSATVVSSSAINLTWTASTDNVGVTGYKVERCSGASCTTFAQIGTPTATSYSDTGLTASTSYSYRVRATDAAGNLSVYSSTVSATTSVAGTIAFVQANANSPLTAVSSVAAVYSSAQAAGDINIVAISWEASTGTVQSIADTLGNTYAVAIGPTTDSGLASQTIYYAKNIAASAANANTVTVTFAAAVPNPDLRIAEYSGISTSSPVDVTVGAFGSSTSMSSGSATTTNAYDLLIGADVVAHSTTGPGTGYTQRLLTTHADIFEDRIVTSTGSYSATAPQDTAGWYVMQLAAFKASSGTGDTTPPTAPTGLGETVVSSTAINLSWTASTDNVGVTGYRVERCSGASCTTFAQIGSPTTTSYSDTGLTASTSYSYRVRATDAAGNLSAYSSTVSGTTLASGDTTPPSAPTGLVATVISSAAINLSWTASTDNVGVTGYLVERCAGPSCTTFAQIGNSTGTTYSDTGLIASTSYSYRVRATDAAGNLSSYSSTVSATTQATADTTPPTAPTGLSASVVSATAISLTWTASTDNVGVTGYKVERCSGVSCTAFSQVGTPTGTSYSDTGLTASTSYSYRVRATDAAGNLSTYSSVVTGTTTMSAGNYTYDSSGRLQTVTTGAGTAHYYYDAAGNVTSIQITNP